jgi:hypothetical protein
MDLQSYDEVLDFLEVFFKKIFLNRSIFKR